MKILGVLILLTVLSACGGRYTVPSEKHLPNPHIGGRVFGPVQP